MNDKTTNLKHIKISVFVVLVCLMWTCNQKKELTLSTNDFKIEFSTDGSRTKATFKNRKIVKELKGFSTLKGCQVVNVKVGEVSGNVITFEKTVLDILNKHSIQLVETFTATSNSIRWNMSITDEGDFWTTPIETHLKVFL
jgi:hypothetical protein